MASNKPASLPYWTQGQANQVAVPPTSLRNTGFTAGQPVAAQHINQLFYELGQYLAFLDQAQGSSILAATLDASVRLLGGGTMGYVASNTTWTWSQPLGLSVPSIPDADNVLAQGSASVPSGCVAYVQANVPFSTTADLISGNTQATNLAYELPIVPGQSVTGTGIAQGTTVAAISGNTVTLSQAATATASQSALTFSGTGPLSIRVAPIDKLVPNSNTVILARGLGTHLLVGVNAAVTVLHDGEQKTLLEPGYLSIVRAPAGQALTAMQAVYIAADTSGGRTQGAVYPTDASATNGASRAHCAGFVYTATAVGQSAAIMTGGILPGFVALTPGASYWLDPVNPGAITSTKPALAATPYVVRVGQALNATTLFARPEHPAEGVFPAIQATTAAITTLTGGSATFSLGASGSFSSTTGFRNTIFGGVLSNVSVPTSGIGLPLLHSNSSAALIPVSEAGSLLGVFVSGATAADANNGYRVTVDIYKNQVLFWSFPTGAWLSGNSGGTGTATNALWMSATAKKGDYPIAKGDILQIIARGASVFGAPALNVYLQGYLTVEQNA